MTIVSYLLAKACVAAFGLPAAFAPSIRRLDAAARVAAAFAFGAVVLTLHAIALSAFQVRWTIVSLAAPPLIAAAIATFVLWRRRQQPSPDTMEPSRRWVMAAAAAWLLMVIALFATRATSADYLFFWGAKASRFAAVGSIDRPLLGHPHMLHLRGLYPPLVPVEQAWTALATGRMQWMLNLADALLWLAAAILLLRGLIRHALGEQASDLIVSFWAAAISASLIASYAGGSAEAQLVFFATVAGAALFLGPKPSVSIAAVALAGAVLTKVEGALIAAVIVVVAAAVSRFSANRLSRSEYAHLAAWPALAYAVWWLFQKAGGLTLSDPLRGNLADFSIARFPAVLMTMLSKMGTAAWGLPWIIPTVVLILVARHWRAAAGPVLSAAAMLGFFLFYYLLERRPLDMVMGWEVPRITQPALSLLILGAGAALYAATRERDVSA